VSLRERLGLEHPIVAAGLGGGLSRARLTSAIAEAGGLGQLGFAVPERLRAELSAHRERGAGPVAVNLLLPFARREHFEIAREADALVTFSGKPRRAGDGIWIHQCGSVQEATEAVAAGADAVIAQGVEAGGHVRGDTPALRLLEEVRAALAPGFPVWVAGGIAEPEDAANALSAGADAVVAGTRFLLSEESDAHPGYKRRLLEAHDTLVTTLFGAGWPARHRVVPNAATERWLDEGGQVPGWLTTLQRVTAPGLSRLPVSVIQRLAAHQRPGQPLLGPAAATTEDPVSLLDSGPLYAGVSVARIDAVRPAGELVRALAGVESAA
jgi:NAD(P)H-dependent flavin oxidoreductase YrpB (nitropropane dioxygenase family)